MLINWETLPTILCLWMAILVSVQYSKLLTNKNILLCIAYFFVLFVAGLPWLAPYGAALRAWASGFFLTLVWLNAGNDSPKKTKALLKLPLVAALLAYSFYDRGRILQTIELVVGIASLIILYWDREKQGVRMRLFIKTTILGIIYLVVKLTQPAWGFQFLAMIVKLAALYYLYCLVSSYAAQTWFKKYAS